MFTFFKTTTFTGSWRRKPRLALHIELADNTLNIWWQDYLDRGFTEFKGDVTYQGKPLARAGRVSRETILDLLGAPYHTDRDEEEEILFYSTPDWEWQFEFTLDGTLKALLIVDNPLMADESFRTSCGLDKPWPPEGNP